MHSLKTIGRELLGLFVADARFTVALMVWIAITGAMPLFMKRADGVEAIVLFLGFAVILVESAVNVAINTDPVCRARQKPMGNRSLID